VQQVERQTAYEAAEGTWRRRLAEAGFLVGDSFLDVVGESHRHRELLGLMLMLRTSPDQYEIQTTAELVPEPTNRHDPNAVKVIIHGVHVGYLEAWQAEEWQPLLRRMATARRRAFVYAVIIGGRPQPDGMIGPIGVQLNDVPEPTA
jgi:hypothetical protein